MSAFPTAGDLESLVVRTDFSDDTQWAEVRRAIARPAMFQANVMFVDDRQYDGLTVERLLELLPEDFEHTFILVIDRETIVQPEHPILVVDLFEVRGRTFRVIPSQLWAVQNNLVIGNQDWDDFAGALDQDGVFRGGS